MVQKKSKEDILAEIEKILQVKEYITDVVKKPSKDEIEERTKKSNLKFRNQLFVSKSDYLYFEVSDYVTKLCSSDSKDLHDVLIKLPRWKLYNFRYILENILVYRKGSISFINILPKGLLYTYLGLLSGKYLGTNSNCIIYLTEILANNLLLFFIVLGIFAYIKESKIPKFFLNIKYLKGFVDEIIKEKEHKIRDIKKIKIIDYRNNSEKRIKKYKSKS